MLVVPLGAAEGCSDEAAEAAEAVVPLGAAEGCSDHLRWTTPTTQVRVVCFG